MKYRNINFKIFCRILQLILLLCVVFYGSYARAGYLDSLSYYTGLGAGYQNVPFQQNYGAGFIGSNTIDVEMFIGGQSNDMFGFELGASVTPQTTKLTTINAGEYYPGASRPLASGTWQTWQTQYETESFYFGINRYLQLSRSGNFRMFAFFGLAATSVDITINFVDDDIPGTPDQATIDNLLRTYNDSRMISMFKLGFEYNFKDNIGARLAYTWKNYAAFGAIKSSEYPEAPVEVRPENTNAVYLSIFVNF